MKHHHAGPDGMKAKNAAGDQRAAPTMPTARVGFAAGIQRPTCIGFGCILVPRRDLEQTSQLSSGDGVLASIRIPRNRHFANGLCLLFTRLGVCLPAWRASEAQCHSDGWERVDMGVWRTPRYGFDMRLLRQH